MISEADAPETVRVMSDVWATQTLRPQGAPMRVAVPVSERLQPPDISDDRDAQELQFDDEVRPDEIIALDTNVPDGA